MIPNKPCASAATVLGVILAGGQSLRMGAVDKCSLVFHGQTLTARAVQRACPQVGQLLVCSDSDVARFANLKVPVIADTLPGYQGPVAGIITAFDWAQNQRCSAQWIATFAADSPYFPLDLTARLLEQANKHNAEVVIPSSQQQPQYAFSLWSMSAAARLAGYTADGDRALKRLVQNYAFTTVDIAKPSNAFFNVNTPDHWRQLQSPG